MKKDYYDILGVSKDASDKEIKSAFRKLAKKYHPDVSKEKDAEAKFKEAQEAYAVLSDAEKRKQYDTYGSAAFDGGSGAGFSGFSDFDFSDIFSDIFGSSFGGGFGGFSPFGKSGGSRATKGSDKLLHIDLSFEEAAFGCDKDLKLEVYDDCDKCDGKGGSGKETCATCHGSGYVASEQRSLFGSFVSQRVCPTCAGKGYTFKETCSKCSGSGKVKKTKTLEVTIPSGVNTGERLRLTGKGDAGLNGGPNGDLYLEFNVKSHKYFVREEEDIYLELPISLDDALLGAKVDVPLLKQTVKLTIPEGSETGDKLRLKGKGIKSDVSGRCGDFYVILKVKMPKRLSRTSKKVIKDLSDELHSSEIDNFYNYFK